MTRLWKGGSMIETILVILAMICSFVAGLKLDRYYQDKASSVVKEALREQYWNQMWVPKATSLNDCPKKQVSKEFMDKLKSEGKATMKL